MREFLYRNHYTINDIDAEERGEDLVSEARNTAIGERKSALKPEQGHQIRRLAKKHATDNEQTFLFMVWAAFFIDTTRLVGVDEDGTLCFTDEAKVENIIAEA